MLVPRGVVLHAVQHEPRLRELLLERSHLVDEYHALRASRFSAPPATSAWNAFVGVAGDRAAGDAFKEPGVRVRVRVRVRPSKSQGNQTAI